MLINTDMNFRGEGGIDELAKAGVIKVLKDLKGVLSNRLNQVSI